MYREHPQRNCQLRKPPREHPHVFTVLVRRGSNLPKHTVVLSGSMSAVVWWFEASTHVNNAQIFKLKLEAPT